MDLWDTACNFLVSNITGKNFRIADVLSLANILNLQLKPPRNANSGQISFLMRDILDLSKQKYPVLDFVSRLSHVKPFEALALQLKDHIINESILCMNGTLRTVYDQQKEISKLKQLVSETNSRSSSSLIEDSMRDLIIDSPYVSEFL